MTIDAPVSSSRPDAARAAIARWDARISRHGAAVAGLTALTAGGYAAYSLVLYCTARTTSYDLVIFDQAVRSYSRYEPGISIIKGVHNGFGPHFSVLGDHFSPILAALGPLYWVYSGPQTLLIAQGILLALAIPFLWVYARRALGGGSAATIAAYFFSVAYALSWPMAAALNAGFHEVAFAPALIAIALERFQAGHPRAGLLALAALLLVKEDMGLLAAGIGIILALAARTTFRRQRLLGAGLVAGGISWTALAVYVLIPAFGGRADYYWAYPGLGANLTQAIGRILTHPASAVHALVTPHAKVHTLFWLVAVLCFLPLLSPVTLAAVPVLLERMLNSKFPNWWLTGFQYNAYVEAILVCGAVDGAARLGRLATWVSARFRRPPAEAGTWRGPTGARLALCLGALAVIGTMITLPRFDFGRVLEPAFYHLTPRGLAAEEAARVVPDGVRVEAVNRIGPLLTSRDTVLLWDGEHPPLGSPWIVADVRRPDFTFISVAAEKARVALLERTGYRAVFFRRGYLVLHRTAQLAAGAQGGFR